MDELGYSFIMAKGMADFIRDIVKEKAGSFETKRQCYVEDYGQNANAMLRITTSMARP